MMGLLIYKFQPFWQEVGEKSLILRWPLRPVGLLHIFTRASHSWKYKKNPVWIPYSTSNHWISSIYRCIMYIVCTVPGDRVILWILYFSHIVNSKLTWQLTEVSYFKSSMLLIDNVLSRDIENCLIIKDLCLFRKKVHLGYYSPPAYNNKIYKICWLIRGRKGGGGPRLNVLSLTVGEDYIFVHRKKTKKISDVMICDKAWC